jgi:hypothetical protein
MMSKRPLCFGTLLILSPLMHHMAGSITSACGRRQIFTADDKYRAFGVGDMVHWASSRLENQQYQDLCVGPCYNRCDLPRMCCPHLALSQLSGSSVDGPSRLEMHQCQPERRCVDILSVLRLIPRIFCLLIKDRPGF